MAYQPSLTYEALPHLAETGSHHKLEGVLPLECVYRGHQPFRLDGGISYMIELSNTGGGVLLRGLARGSGMAECARCLEEAAFDVEGGVEGYFILNPSEQELEFSDDEFNAMPPDGVIDLDAPIIAAIIYELPQVLLCKPDCAGLCANCGANLNMESCDCDSKLNPDSPFAVLKDLFEFE